MTIAFYCMCSGGGTERATAYVANCLSCYHKVHIIDIYHQGPSFPLNDGISYHQIKAPNKLRHIRAAAKYLSDNHIDILVVVEAMGGLLAYPAAKLARCRVVIWEHANYYQNQGISYINKVRQFELKHCDAYVLLTDKDKGNFERNFKIKAMLRRIYNIAPEMTDNEYAVGSKTIISAGHIHKIKNFILIPEIGRIVFQRHPDWRWLIFGAAAGGEYERIKRKTEEYGLEYHIIFAGRSEHMQDEYCGAAMYVMTSLQEGLPMVLLEAKANKLPLISFDIQTGPDEIIRDNVNGYLVPPYDAEQMAEKICSLIENEALRKSFSDRSQLDMEKFGLAPIEQQWIELMNELENEG